jgi:protein tyrosine/serine phosphatase
MIIKASARLFLSIGVGIILLLAACNCQSGQTQVINPNHSFQAPQNNIAGLSNIAQVSEALYRGAQPDEAGFRELKKMGIKTIINLRDFHSDKDKIKGLGFRYCEIPSNAADIEENEIIAFIKAATDPVDAPAFVHCQHGSDRTGLMVAIYRIYVMGWSKAEALKELDAFGWHHIYFNIPGYIDRFDKDKFKSRVDKAPAPKVEIIE